MNEFLSAFIVGESFLLGFLLYFFPLEQNAKANKRLSFFVFILGTAFIGTYLERTGLEESYRHLIKIVNSLQFLLAPCLYFSILYFVNPTSHFKIRYWLHFLPFAICASLDNFIFWSEKSISTTSLLQIGETEFWVRDSLPFLVLIYVALSYFTLEKHGENLELINSTTQRKDLKWIKHFLIFLLLPLAFWINDALAVFAFPLLVELTGYIYAGSILFLAFNALRQGAIYPYENEDLEEISDILQAPDSKSKIHRGADVQGSTVKIKSRLNEEQLAVLTVKLNELMNVEKIYLENELDLPAVAAKLGVSIHDASYLINKIGGDKFYNFINRYRIEEAKRLLTSSEAKNLNMLGIAFESGFNSKTAFNTAFKKWVDCSPSEYVKQQENHSKDVRLDNSERINNLSNGNLGI